VTGVYGVGTDSGVYGTTNSSTYPAVSGEGLSVGVYGAASGGSNTSGGNAGIWGDTGGASGSYTAVVGTAADNPAGGFYNNSADSPTITATNASSDGTGISGNGGVTGVEGGADVYALLGNGGTYGGYLNGQTPLVANGPMGWCAVNDAGSLICQGSKSAAVPLADDRWVRLYAVESPENWFEDFGSGKLSNGSAVVALEPTFAQTVSTSTDYHVFLTPNGDSRGLYVFAKTATSFEVREQGGGISSIAFDYRIVARRKGYENIRMEDVTELNARIVVANERIAKQIPPHRPPAMKTGDGPRPAPQSAPVTPKLPPMPPVWPAVKPVAAQPK
jgi:hypothetical protein